MNTDSTLTLMSQPSATSPSEFPTATSERRTELAHSSLADSDIQDSTLRQRYSSTSNYANDKQKPKAFSSSSSSSEEMKEESYFECNICLATAREPVVTLCGHLYCWRCLSRWINSTQRKANTCPVCASLISKDKIIPIYVKSSIDPRINDFSPGDGDHDDGARDSNQSTRPSGQRTEAPPINPMQNPFSSFFPFNLGGGDQANNIQFNVGFFPFFFPFGIQMNVQGPGRRQARTAQAGDAVDDLGGFMSRLFLMLATLILVSIILY